MNTYFAIGGMLSIAYLMMPDEKKPVEVLKRALPVVIVPPITADELITKIKQVSHTEPHHIAYHKPKSHSGPIYVPPVQMETFYI